MSNYTKYYDGNAAATSFASHYDESIEDGYGFFDHDDEESVMPSQRFYAASRRDEICTDEFAGNCW